MSKYLIDSTTLTSIGDAIRSKTGETNPILVSDLATAIENIQSGGAEETAQYDYIYLVPSNTRNYFDINLYDYVDNIDDIVAVVARLSSSYSVIWNNNLEQSLAIDAHRDNVTSSISGSGDCTREWGDLLGMASRNTNGTTPIGAIINDSKSNIGWSSCAWFDSVNKLYFTYDWRCDSSGVGWTKTSVTASNVTGDSSYKYLFIVYKTQEGE